jgi:hypothetical protein
MDRPIIFSGSMIRAILDGRKIQTRRTIKHDQQFWEHGGYRPCLMEDGVKWTFLDRETGLYAKYAPQFKCPYGAPGDRLWVRETWGPCDGGFCYAADEGVRWRDVKPDDGRWHSSIHMPREFSRITLEIVAVRVERVSDISEDDAIAEGVEEIRPLPSIRGATKGRGWRDYGIGVGFHQARQSFHSLWNTINKARGFGWDQNPWVWVITFKRAAP